MIKHSGYDYSAIPGLCLRLLTVDRDVAGPPHYRGPRHRTKPGEFVTKEELIRQAEITIRKNEIAIEAARQRSDYLERAAEHSVRIVENALRQLRTGR
jgi:hypothetical protein